MAIDSYRFIAGGYDFLTSVVFMGKMKEAKRSHLYNIKENDRVLIIGGGTGYELKLLVEKYPGISIDYVETSASMMKRASGRLSSSIKNIRFISEDKIPETQYDAVITSFFLDLYGQDQMESRASEIIDRLNSGGSWILTDFENHKGRFWQKGLSRFMYAFFKIFTGLKTNKLPDFSVLRIRDEIREVSKTSYYGGFIFSSRFERI